jgi:hypothetical protein
VNSEAENETLSPTSYILHYSYSLIFELGGISFCSFGFQVP